MNKGFEVIPSEGLPIKAWTRGVPVADNAIAQLRNLALMPFVFKHVAVMPDCHWGNGSTVGSVFATRGAVIPAAVGVDIGCGMSAVRTNLVAADLPKDLSVLRAEIERVIPHGRTDNGGNSDRGAWSTPSIEARDAFGPLEQRLNALVNSHPVLDKASKRAPQHMGTLGTGNHYVEVCLDESDRVWVVLHSGSRGIGAKIGQYFMQMAKDEMKKWHITIPDADLAYFPQGTGAFDDYMKAVAWAQEYAKANRCVMMDAALHALSLSVDGTDLINVDTEIDCHHNYVAWENHFGENVLVTRKGAIRAREGDYGIIPGSMGARSFIVKGKGHPVSFCSSSHGAGRIMSRTEAEKTFTIEQHKEDTKGIECRKDAGVLDETPRAYKNIDDVMAAQSDLIDIVHTLRQIVCVKG